MVEAYQQGRVSFKDVVFFQLEEYCNLSKMDPESYAFLLYEWFFKFVDVDPEHVFFLNGTATNKKEECTRFENAIKEKGGLKFACVEVDSEASIGGNAPGSSLDSYTREKTLTSMSLHDRYYSRNGQQDTDIADLSANPFGHNRVLTMGLATISNCSEVFALCLGSHSARALRHIVEECISNMFPASVLQLHSCACILCDRYSMCTLKYTDVSYFAGIRENYQLVVKDEVTDFRSFVLQPDTTGSLMEEDKKVFSERNLTFENLRCHSPVPN